MPMANREADRSRGEGGKPREPLRALLISSFLILSMLTTGGRASAAISEEPTPRPPISGRAVSRDALLPADVLARVELLRAELELIRFEMGRPKALPIEASVANVVPREVIFQAFTTYQRANQLRYEVSGLPGPLVQVRLPKQIEPFDVWQVVDIAYEQVRFTKQELGITEQVEETPSDLDTTPARVFGAILQVNREFDLLVTQSLDSNDVYHQVKLATHYAARLLGQFPESVLLPDAPARQRGRKPAEVYGLLARCYRSVHAVAENSGIDTLKFEPLQTGSKGSSSHEIGPGDVHDLAILLVSELGYLFARLDSKQEQPRPKHDLDLKLPSHVYQRGEILQAQLRALESYTSAEKDWLARVPEPR